MSDEDALLAAIAANPDEDTPRLAYADWLDEHADALPDPGLARTRAEFIRVQTERLRCPYWLPDHTARYGELIRREHEIQTRCTAALLDPVANAARVEVRFSRGFPSLHMPVGVFLAHADRFARLRPPELTVTNVVEHWYDFATHPHLPVVTHAVMRATDRWYRPANAGQWSLAGGVLGRMGELGRRNRLRGLDVSHCRVGDDGASQLADHAYAWRLEDLDLSHNEIQYLGLVELLLSPIPAALKRINLGGNPIDDRAARLLAERWPANDALKWLRLEGTNIGPRGRQLLLDRFGGKVELGPV